MLDKSKIKIADTKTLRTINKTSDRLGYNRVLNDKALRDLQPLGVHLVSSMLIHEHAAGQDVEAHMRCHVWLAVKGKTYPIEAMIDMPMGDYERLQTLAEYEAEIEQASA